MVPLMFHYLSLPPLSFTLIRTSGHKELSDTVIDMSSGFHEFLFDEVHTYVCTYIMNTVHHTVYVQIIHDMHVVAVGAGVWHQWLHS